MQALKLKDGTIKNLEQQLQRMATELARAEERAKQAEAEKSQLKVNNRTRTSIYQECKIFEHSFSDVSCRLIASC